MIKKLYFIPQTITITYIGEAICSWSKTDDPGKPKFQVPARKMYV